MVAMSQVLGDEYARLVQQVGADHASLHALERHAFGLDHAEVGAALAEEWKLPPLLVAPIRYHETPDAAGEMSCLLCAPLRLETAWLTSFSTKRGAGSR